METKVLTTLEEIKIFSDPYRLQILNVFNKLDRPATVKEVSDEMGEVPAKVHYHVKKLEKIGLLSMVSTKEINGIIAKYYEPFSGEIQIKRQDEQNEPSANEMMRSETFKLLSELYEQNKERFFRQVSNSEKPHARITSSPLYMTNEEAQAFFKEVTNMSKKYETKKKGEEYHRYEFFATIIRNDME
ncbi:winged helix-turn-helix domain-containing protein [Paenibacillus dakarensis]|uniref:winged helix-turn-helix domain-containing protein n=1 Tax=Paenibacillus dakarensis TaxID=1527293 RepID=UPI0006D58BB0|nr:helix-turn-helix domain-containing protein [Paenibacillus dakarensis]